MKKVTKTQVIAKLKKMNDGDILEVSLLPSKTSFSGFKTWVQPYKVELYKDQGEFYHNISEDDSQTFDSLINEFSYYNCNAELGNRVHFYIND